MRMRIVSVILFVIKQAKLYPLFCMNLHMLRVIKQSKLYPLFCMNSHILRI
jgi:hypothetical protein